MTGIGLIAFVAAFVFWKHKAASALFLLFGGSMVVFGLREFFSIARALGAKGYEKWTIACCLTLALMPGAISCFPFLRRLSDGMQDKMTGLPGFMDMAVMAVYLIGCFAILFRSDDFTDGVKGLFASLAGFFYVGWTMSFLARIYFWDYQDVDAPGRFLFLYVVIVTKFGDIGGYTLGKIMSKRKGGNHKIIPRVSPGKSWEGLCGSVLFSVGIALILERLLGSGLDLGNAGALNGGRNVLVAVFLALLGLVSDLTESTLKRASGVKDSGSTLPGLGGVLDAVDSLLLVAPIFYCYLIYATSM